MMVRLALLTVPLLALAACGQGNDPADPPNRGSVTLELPPATPFRDAGNEAANVSADENAASAAANLAQEEEPAPETGNEAAASDEEAPAVSEAAPKEAPVPDTASDEVRLRAARPPLSDTEIARTIDRIGFACGEVIAANRVESADREIYKINCSSGKSYQATMRDGRMRFREWTGRLARD